jgi:hypothetical protein
MQQLQPRKADGHVDRFNIVRNVVAAKPFTSVKPREFFISWSGVPTLAYQGFSPTLVSIKRELETLIPGLKQDNPGSRWPKTTLGALRDGRTLSLGEVRTLREICDELNAGIREDGIIEVRRLSFVVSQCRSLERRLLTLPVALAPRDLPAEDDKPSQEELDRVEATMAQFTEPLERYLRFVQRDGNRESHYRTPHIESTLIFDLARQQPLYMAEFIDQVEARLPGRYSWFDRDCRHITHRGFAS